MLARCVLFVFALLCAVSTTGCKAVGNVFGGETVIVLDGRDITQVDAAYVIASKAEDFAEVDDPVELNALLQADRRSRFSALVELYPDDAKAGWVQGTVYWGDKENVVKIEIDEDEPNLFEFEVKKDIVEALGNQGSVLIVVYYEDGSYEHHLVEGSKIDQSSTVTAQIDDRISVTYE